MNFDLTIAPAQVSALADICGAPGGRHDLAALLIPLVGGLHRVLASPELKGDPGAVRHVYADLQLGESIDWTGPRTVEVSASVEAVRALGSASGAWINVGVSTADSPAEPSRVLLRSTHVVQVELATEAGHERGQLPAPPTPSPAPLNLVLPLIVSLDDVARYVAVAVDTSTAHQTHGEGGDQVVVPGLLTLALLAHHAPLVTAPSRIRGRFTAPLLAGEELELRYGPAEEATTIAAEASSEGAKVIRQARITGQQPR